MFSTGKKKRMSSDITVDDFWLIPLSVYEKLNKEFHFDFDPCPHPRPPGFNSLVLPWGKSNFVNPPFMRCPLGGPTAFLNKAIFESAKGNQSVLLLPVSSTIFRAIAHMKAVRVLGRVQFENIKGESRPMHENLPIIAFVI